MDGILTPHPALRATFPPGGRFGCRVAQKAARKGGFLYQTFTFFFLKIKLLKRRMLMRMKNTTTMPKVR